MSILWRSTKAPTVSSVESRKCSESQAEQRKGGSKLSDPTLLGIFHLKEISKECRLWWQVTNRSPHECREWHDAHNLVFVSPQFSVRVNIIMSKAFGIQQTQTNT